MIVATLFIFFSGAPFTFYLVGVPIGAALYVGFTTPVILGAQDRTLEGSDIEYGKVVFASSVLLGVSIDLVIYCLLLILGSYLMDSTHRRTFLQRTLLVKQQEQIIKEKTKNESMQKLFLENILPSFLVGKLKEPRDARAGLSQRHVGVSMLFADLVGFTAFSSQVDPFKVMIFLNDLFQVFDSLCDQYNVYKVETVGDSYVAAVGVITGQLTDADGDTSVEVRREKASSNAKDAVGFAKAMIKGCRIVSKPEVNTPAIVRIGIHTGACISGIIGTRNLKFSLLGDVVVTAAHMEQLGRPDHIHASQQVVELTPEEPWEKHRVVNLRGNRRGKQCCIQTYLLA
jgi:class 3 adenylate cyclase